MYDSHALIFQPLCQAADRVANPAGLERLAESLYSYDEAVFVFAGLDDNFLVQSSLLDVNEEYVSESDKRLIRIDNNGSTPLEGKGELFEARKIGQISFKYGVVHGICELDLAIGAWVIVFAFLDEGGVEDADVTIFPLSGILRLQDFRGCEPFLYAIEARLVRVRARKVEVLPVIGS